MKMSRIHVLLDEEQKARYRRQAEREGKSLGAWLRDAAEQKLAAAAKTGRIETLEELRAFFQSCDAREEGPEPDWKDHLRVMDRSRGRGGEPT